MNKKDPHLKDSVCRKHCSYYKPNGKEDLACGGYQVLETALRHIPFLIDQIGHIQDHPFEDKAHQTLHHLLCRSCDFFIDGCDFTDPDVHDTCLPCGGYIVLDKLLAHRPSSVTRPLLNAITPERLFGVLSPATTLKHLEERFLYHIPTDELYALDKEGFDFLSRCNGSHPLKELTPDIEFLEYCLEDGLLEITDTPIKSPHVAARSPIPSLRYLELQITNRCNLHCKHCYLGPATKTDMPLDQIQSVIDMFESMQGLRLIVSGGEPLMHPAMASLKTILSKAKLRKVLLTNGTLLRDDNHALWDFFDEVQFSLDGMKKGHEALRGAGTYDQTTRGMEAARKRGLDVSVATMIHSQNLSELEEMAAWIGKQDIFEWSLDIPCASGRLWENNDMAVRPEEGAPFLKMATGGSYHGSEEPFACGYHLCTVTPEGKVLKCGFYPETPLGTIHEGLETCWSRMEHIPLTALDCAPCPHLLDCKGGCRFRADHARGKDPVMCALYDVR